jgi:putative transposase
VNTSADGPLKKTMTTAQLQHYLDDNGLTEGARSCINIIRASAPAWQGPAATRGFNGADKRAAGYAEVPAEDSRWASALAANGNVLEVYYQPPRSPSSAGAPAKVSAPYFFVLWADRAGWADCQTEDDLERMALQQPGRYCRDVSGRWRSPIGEAFARPLGLCYRVLTPAQVFGRLAADDFHARPSSCDGVRRSQARAAAGHNHDNEA